MSPTVSVPVWVRVGTGPEIELGALTTDEAVVPQLTRAALARMLRAVAGTLDQAEETACTATLPWEEGTLRCEQAAGHYEPTKGVLEAPWEDTTGFHQAAGVRWSDAAYGAVPAAESGGQR